MNCLRCGQRLEEDGSFCASCQEEMEKYPVEPGTPVILPKEKPGGVPVRQTVKQSPEKKIAQQNKTIRFLTIALFVLVLLIVLETLLIFGFAKKQQGKPIGQNYSTETTQGR